MKALPAIMIYLALIAAPAFASGPTESVPTTASDEINVAEVSPALERYMRDTIDADLWKRPQLSPRDRSVVTLAVVIARNQTAELAPQVRRALDNGVTPAEILEIITHLAFYSGLGNAKAAISVTAKIFAERGIQPSQLPAASPKLLAMDEDADAVHCLMLLA